MLPGPDTAKESSFELDYYEDENGTFGRVTSVQLQPEACFMADRELDFTIVALGTCRVFGDCRRGDRLDRELGDLIGSVGPLERQQKLFRYARYNAELSREGLDLLDCRDIEPEVVQKMDSIDGIPELKKVGRQVAKKKVELADFEGFPAV